MRQLIKINIVLLLTIGTIVLANGTAGKQVTASKSESIVVSGSKVYLPIIVKNHDGSLGIPLFGVQLYGSTQTSSPYYPYLINSGASWIRVNVPWNQIEPNNVSPSSYNWTVADNNLAAARHDLGGSNIVATIEQNPTWAAGNADGVIYPDKLDDFAEFVGVLVERFDGDGIDDAPGSPVVLYWEFYNEPDRDSRWGNNGASYANMLATVYPAVKAANPNAQVVLGGLAYDWFKDNGGPFIRSFMSDILAAGGGNYFDIGNIHYYPVFAPNWTTDSSLGLSEKVNNFRSVLISYGFDKPVILTESGWHDNDVVGVPSTPELQSKYVVQIFTESMATDIDVMIWWMLYDIGNFYPYNNGLVTNAASLPIQEKLSYGVFQNVVTELQTSHFVRTLSVNETKNSDLDVYLFQDNVNGRSIYVTWLNPVDTTATRSLHLPASTATVRNSLTNSILNVPNISCGHCVNSIKTELSEMDGIIGVEGNPDTKEITVRWKAPATLEAIRELLKEINYPAE